MRKFRALFVQEFLYSIRHPYREILPLLFYGLLTFLGVSLGYHRMISQMENYETITWMLPNLVVLYFIISMFQYGKNSISRKRASDYLTHLRILNASGGGLYTALVLEAFIRGILKSALLVLLYWLLFGTVESYISWLYALALSVPIGFFWFGFGFIIGMNDRDQISGGKVLAEIVIPFLAISGFLFPMAYYPSLIEQISYYLPTTLGFYLPRVFFGMNTMEVWMIPVLAVWGLASLITGFIMLKRASA